MKYAMEIACEKIKELLEKTGMKDIDIETPPSNISADFAVPFYRLANIKKKKPDVLAMETMEKINLKNSFFKKVERNGNYLNFYIDFDKFSPLVFNDMNEKRDQYGGSNVGNKKTIIIDYSSPNIAKPFSVGHLRSTVLGDSLKKIFSFVGYNAIGDNHLGDWGTQFGKLLTAYEKWGDDKKIEKDGSKALLELYAKFHIEAKKNSKLNNEARAWFKKLEDDDKDTVKIWKHFRELSIEEFEKIYNILDVNFDEMLGESFYNKMSHEIISDCEKKKIAKWVPALDEAGKPLKNEKMLLVDLNKHGIKTPLILKKSDGTTLYATRDLAAIKYRIKHWNPEKIFYVVGSEQKLYFQQLFKTAELLGYKTEFAHIDFGLIQLPDGKMSSREGRVVILEDLIDEVIKRAKILINNKDISVKMKDEINNTVAIGAIKYADLSQNRIKNIIFDWNKIINLKGDSGPYLQYSYVRINSILEKAGKLNLDKINAKLLTSNEEIDLIKCLSLFPEGIIESAKNYSPNIIANYLFNLSQKFNCFYENVPVNNIKNKELKKSRLILCRSTAQIIKKGLELLGINCPKKM